MAGLRKPCGMMPGMDAPLPPATLPAQAPCPCDLARPYAQCCGRWHAGPLQGQAPDAAALMRSRYAAYVLQLAPYLLATWHVRTRPPSIDFEPGLRWLGLQVQAHRPIDADHAEVRFVARSKQGGRAQPLAGDQPFRARGGPLVLCGRRPAGRRLTPHAAAPAVTAGPPGTAAAPAGLRLLLDDGRLLAVDKPAGLLVHRSALDAHADDDLVSRLRHQLQAAVWPVHRLDKGTSGLLLLCRDATTAATLQRAWTTGQVQKHYLALVRGWPDDAGEIDQPLARDPELPSTGQPQLAACTRWQVLRRLCLPIRTHPAHADTRLALVAVQPLTGRRHQIRRHFKAMAHPLIGDATHGKGPLNRAVAEHLGTTRLWLHAQRLALPHPGTGQLLDLQAPPGPEWASVCPATGGAATFTSPQAAPRRHPGAPDSA